MQSREQKQQILTANVYTSRSTFGNRFIRLVPRPGENESTDRVNNNMNDAHDAYRSWLNFFMMMFGVSCMQLQPAAARFYCTVEALTQRCQ